MNGGELPVSDLEKFWRTDDELTAAERAAAYGIDLSLIEDNLRLSASERMERNEEALALVRSLGKPRGSRAGT